MTIAYQVPADNDVIAAGKINSRLTLIILAVKQLVVFDCDVVRLIELN